MDYKDSPRARAQTEMNKISTKEFRKGMMKLNKEIVKEVRENGNFNTKPSK